MEKESARDARMPEIVVFLGPSLPRDKAEQILQADFRPPAKRGDLFKAAKDGADIICLIDGVFFQDCSVAHKEILYALEHGVRVIGASRHGGSASFPSWMFLAWKAWARSIKPIREVGSYLMMKWLSYSNLSPGSLAPSRWSISGSTLTVLGSEA